MPENTADMAHDQDPLGDTVLADDSALDRPWPDDADCQPEAQTAFYEAVTGILHLRKNVRSDLSSFHTKQSLLCGCKDLSRRCENCIKTFPLSAVYYKCAERPESGVIYLYDALGTLDPYALGSDGGRKAAHKISPSGSQPEPMSDSFSFTGAISIATPHAIYVVSPVSEGRDKPFHSATPFTLIGHTQWYALTNTGTEGP